MLYLWIKAFHIISMTCWFAGLFYLPRLYVYHAMSEDSISIERFKVMERKLYRGIMMPSMILTLAFGLWLLHMQPLLLKQAWFHAKLALIVALLGYHHACGRLLKGLINDPHTRSHTFYRFFNEFPVLILLGIVILVMVKPF
ncbi:MAG: protoporphyrinogen oxidase HemJ [Endozoicomonadaceae bacterium]|nr:protoporphyrinogen oxidase HemJ [Endozoicomonadaceae bacterium]